MQWDDHSVTPKAQSSGEIWDQHAVKMLEVCCTLINALSLTQFRNKQFESTYAKMDLLEGMIFNLKSEANLLLPRLPFLVLRDSMCAATSPIDGKMSRFHTAGVHINPDSILLYGKRGNEFSR